MWTAETLSHLATGYWPAATLIAAVELGVFDALDAGPADAATLAAATRVGPDRLRVLLDGLAAIGVLRRGIRPPNDDPAYDRTAPTRLTSDCIVWQVGEATTRLGDATARAGETTPRREDATARAGDSSTTDCGPPPASTARAVASPQHNASTAASDAVVYALPDDLRPLLSRRSPACLLDALAYNADLYRQWANLADVVRGHAPAVGPRQLGGDPAATRRFVRAMEAKATVFTPAIARAIDPGDPRTLLDVGSGPGTLSRRLAGACPRLRVTLLDLPPVLDVAREINAASPLVGRLTYHPADYRAAALPGGFDVVLFAGALHQETPASAAALAARLHDALVPGGRAFVVDLMLDHGRTSPAFSALFQINMMLLRPGARVFTTGETVGLLQGAGFATVRAVEVAGTPYRVVSGTRPAVPPGSVPSPGMAGRGLG